MKKVIMSLAVSTLLFSGTVGLEAQAKDGIKTYNKYLDSKKKYKYIQLKNTSKAFKKINKTLKYEVMDIKSYDDRKYNYRDKESRKKLSSYQRKTKMELVYAKKNKIKIKMKVYGTGKKKNVYHKTEFIFNQKNGNLISSK